LISGLHGAHHVKDQWLTIRKCLKKEEKNGVTNLRSLVSVLIKLLMLLLSMSTPKNGTRLSTITELNQTAVNSMESTVFLM